MNSGHWPVRIALAVLVMVLALVPTLALGADLFVPPAPAVFDAFNWDGPYLGLSLGGEYVSVTNSDPFSQLPSGPGILALAFAGYNVMRDNWLGGVEADIGYSGFHGQGACLGGDGFCSDHTGLYASLRARGGRLVNTALFYLTGGVAILGFGGTVRIGPTSSGYQLRVGPTVGGGVEVPFGRRTTARIEYRYADFGSRNVSFGPVVFPNTAITTQAILAGVAWKLD